MLTIGVYEDHVAQKKKTICEWTPDVYGDFFPQCYTLDIPLDSYIVEQYFKYCPFCGNQIKIGPFSK